MRESPSGRRKRGPQELLFLCPLCLVYVGEAASEGDAKKFDHKSEEDADDIEHGCDLQIFFEMIVGAEEYQKAHAGADQKSCHHLPCTEHSLQIELCDRDTGGAVRDQSDQTGKESSEEGLAGQEVCKRLGTEALHKDRKDQCNQKYEKHDMHRMHKGGMQNAAFLLFTAAVLLFTEIMDPFLGLRTISREAKDKINAKSRDHANESLRGNDLHHGQQWHLFGDEDRKHFIGGGQEDCHQRADGQKTSGIETGSGCREAALRNDAENAPDDRTEAADLRDGLRRTLLCFSLEIFHYQIGDK